MLDGEADGEEEYIDSDAANEYNVFQIPAWDCDLVGMIVLGGFVLGVQWANHSVIIQFVQEKYLYSILELREWFM